MNYQKKVGEQIGIGNNIFGYNSKNTANKNK
jgi:hypothetical protein